MGFRTVFNRQPRQDSLPQPAKMAEEIEPICEKEIAALLVKGAISKVRHLDGESISNFFSPTQVIEYFGMEIDPAELLFRLPTDKVSKLRLKCRELLSKPRTSARQISSVLGDFVWAIPSTRSHKLITVTFKEALSGY